MKLSKLKLVLASLITIGALAAPAYSYAEGSSGSGTESGSTSSSGTDDTTTSGSTETHNSTTGAHIEATDDSRSGAEVKAAAQAKIAEHTEEQKTKRCEKRQADVNKITARIAERGQRQIDLFSTIATRVEAFYVKKGVTLSNYDQLVAAVDSAKANAQTTVDTIKTTTITLKCDGTDPNGAGASFKAALKAEIQALKDYRTAVKNLIVGVKSVTSTTHDDSSTEGSQQ